MGRAGTLRAVFPEISRETFEVFLFLLPILIVSMTLHEMAHGYVAWRLGDPTSKMLGRLSPNPIRHVDPLGTAMFAITWFGSGGTFLFGWAKPIPVQPRFFNHPQRGMATVAVAGPIVNFVIALLFAAYLVHGPELSGIAGQVVVAAFLVNIVLGIFNLFPIPPLDGSRIVGAVMPRAMYERWIELDRYGMIILLGIFFLFRGPFFEIIGTLTQAVTRVMITIVGG